MKIPAPTRWFSEIGLAHAQNYRELEAARVQYEVELGGILKTLEPIFEKSLVKTIGGEVEIELEDGEWLDATVYGSAYAKYCVEKKGSERYYAGASIGIYAGREDFGFQGCVWFKISQPSYRALDLANPSSDLLKKLEMSPPVESEHDAGYWILRTRLIVPSDSNFTADGLRAATEKVADHFMSADRWLLDRYRRHKEGGD